MTDFSGRPIGPLRLARSMVFNIIAGTCFFSAIAVLWPPAPITILFLEEQLGASKTLIGLNLSLVLFGTTVSLLGAWPFSRMRQRKARWIILTASARMFMFVPAIVAVLSYRAGWHVQLAWVFLFSLLIVHAGSVFTSSGWWSWMGDLIPENLRGSFFGRRFRWNLIGQSVTALLGGFLLDAAAGTPAERWVYSGIFFVAAALVVSDALLFSFVPEPMRPEPERRTSRQVLDDYLHPIRDRAFRRALLSVGVYNFFFYISTVFQVLFLRGEDVDGVWIGGRASVAFLSMMVVVFTASVAVGSHLWGRLADRIGHRVVWMLGSSAYVTHLYFFFVNEHTYAYLALANAAVFGLLFSGQQMAGYNLTLSMAPPNRREYYIAMYQSMAAATAALSPVLGGVIADRFHVFSSIHLPSGQPACYLHLLIAITLAGMIPGLLLMLRVPDSKGSAYLPWVSRLVTGQLLKTAWNIGVLTTSASAPRRARALRRIGRHDGNLLLQDVVAALSDSDPTVRREALLALGRIGTAEAMDILRWHLHEPDARIRAPSVEALGQLHSPERRTLLKRALHDPDSRVRQAAVAALSRSGDPDAAQALRDLLADERDGEVLVSAAIALSKLKEFGAVNEMINLALYSDNTTVRSQMLVALADLLSGTDDFHRLWRADRQWRGRGFFQLARRLRRQARAMSRVRLAGATTRWIERRQLVAAVDQHVDTLLEYVDTEQWGAAFSILRDLAILLLRLQYGYEGDADDALEFASAVSPNLAQQHWLITYLRHAHESGGAPEAAWDGLTLLGLHTLLHGQDTPS